MSASEGTKKRVLQALQSDHGVPGVFRRTLADRANVSRATFYRTCRELKANGFIRRIVAILDRDKLNLPITGFMNVVYAGTDAAGKISEMPEVLEAHRVTGFVLDEPDSLLIKVVARTTNHFAEIQQRIGNIKGVTGVRTGLVMETIRESHEIPVS